MSLTERRYGVWLYSDRIGALNQRGDYTWFAFSEEYLADPGRAVLGLIFEQDLRRRHASALRLPPWFSNLLPEGRLRDWIAADRGVSADREMELLAQVGHDLPGAVRIVLEDGAPDSEAWDPEALQHEQTTADSGDGRALGWRFSLAGVGLKFSMLRQNDRLTLPAFGEGGDWVVKLPDATYVDVPRNEHAMMMLAASVGIEVPEHTLVRRGDLEGLPEHVWPGSEEFAYAVRRFDRGENRTPIHIEDFAQVRNFSPHAGQKYQGSFETVAALVYRRRDLDGLYEFVRRLTFNILISNGDAHLKNWSLIYRDRRVPTLSPAYDLVSTAFYQTGDSPEDLGLRFDGTKRFDQVKVDGFARLEKKLGVTGADLAGCAVDTIERVVAAWPAVAGLLDANPRLRDSIAQSIQQRSRTLLRSV